MDLIDDDAPGRNTPEYTVSEISGAVKRTLEDQFGRIRVRGEVGRVFRAKSGHLYYDVKDDRSVLACTTWKGQVGSLSVLPEEGLEVIVTGRLSAFGQQSKYNLNVDEIAVAGEGALMAMLEKRRKALAAEGLFDPDRKRQIPFLPDVIGVITSPQGAVIRDILHRLRDRFPRKVLVWPVAVQGSACAPEVTRAIEGFNRLSPGGALPRPDVLIVARGGGSIEDLWGFNEESVVRAAAASQIPLISAVGHETDTTLIDHAADRRAPTPTAAAEMAVPVRVDLLAWLDGQGARLSGALARGLDRRGQRLRDVSRALPRPESLLRDAERRFDAGSEALPRALQGIVARSAAALARVAGGLRPQPLRHRIVRDGDRVARLGQRLGPAVARLIAARADRLATVARPQPLRQRLVRDADGLAGLARRLDPAIARILAARRDRLAAAARLNETLSYRATLARGYAVVRGDGAVVTTAAAALRADLLEIEFADGRMRPGAAADEPPRPKPAPRKSPPPDQGSLF